MSETVQAPDVGRRLAAARMRRGLSQAAVARLSGFAPSYLSRIETGKVHPTFRTVLRIAAALRMPFAEVAGPGSIDRRHDRACPVSASGHCMLDLIRSETAAHVEDEVFTARQIQMLRRFAEWIRRAPLDRQRAAEVLLRDLTRTHKTRQVARQPAAAGQARPDEPPA